MKLKLLLEMSIDIDHINQLLQSYIDNNDKELCFQIKNKLENLPGYIKYLNDEYTLPKKVYRGVKTQDSNNTILFNERDSELVSTTKDYNVAKSYAGKNGKIIEYNITSTSVMIDIDLWNEFSGSTIDNESEVIIDARYCSSIQI